MQFEVCCRSALCMHRHVTRTHMENQGLQPHPRILMNATMIYEQHTSMPSRSRKNYDLSSSIGQDIVVDVCKELFRHMSFGGTSTLHVAVKSIWKTEARNLNSDINTPNELEFAGYFHASLHIGPCPSLPYWQNPVNMQVLAHFTLQRDP